MEAFGSLFASGSRSRPPSFDDTWCLCGNFVYTSAIMCSCGFPTARYCRGDWECGKCGFANFARNFEISGRGCRKCAADIGMGSHAFGDDSTDRAKLRAYLTPRASEEQKRRGTAAARPHHDVPRDASGRSTLTGWDAEYGPNFSLITEGKRFQEDKEQRGGSGHAAWDRQGDPCPCDRHDLSRRHLRRCRRTQLCLPQAR